MYTPILKSQGTIMLFSNLAEQCLIVLLACVASGLSRDGTTVNTKQWDSKRNVSSISVRGSVKYNRSLCSSRVKLLCDEHKDRRRFGTGTPFPKQTTSYTTGYSLIRTFYQLFISTLFFTHLRLVSDRK